MANDPKNKITDALTDPEARTDMLSIYSSKEQKRFDTALVYGATVYNIPHYLDWLQTDRRQQMAMKAKGTTPRSEQLKEAMMAGKDQSAIYAGSRPLDEYQKRRPAHEP